MHLIARKHKQKLWDTLQNPLESTDFKLREHVTYTMLGAVSFKSKAPKSEGAEPIKYPSRSVAQANSGSGSAKCQNFEHSTYNTAQKNRDRNG